jgi:hypothetical protein
MTLLALTLTAVLAQAGAPELTAADRSALAAERAAVAAEKAAMAAERIAQTLAPQPTAPQAAPADAPAAKQGWLGNAGLGLTFITGNTQTLTLTGSFAADRKWDAWSMAVRLSGGLRPGEPRRQRGRVNDGDHRAARQRQRAWRPQLQHIRQPVRAGWQ